MKEVGFSFGFYISICMLVIECTLKHGIWGFFFFFNLTFFQFLTSYVNLVIGYDFSSIMNLNSRHLNTFHQLNNVVHLTTYHSNLDDQL